MQLHRGDRVDSFQGKLCNCTIKIKFIPSLKGYEFVALDITQIKKDIVTVNNLNYI